MDYTSVLSAELSVSGKENVRKVAGAYEHGRLVRPTKEQNYNGLQGKIKSCIPQTKLTIDLFLD